MWKHGEQAAARFTARYLAVTGRARQGLPLWEIVAAAGALGSLHAWGLPAARAAEMRRRARDFLAQAGRELGGEEPP